MQNEVIKLATSIVAADFAFAPPRHTSFDGNLSDDLPTRTFSWRVCQAGSTSFLVLWEGNNNLHRTVERIKARGKRAGVAINPATPAAILEEILPDLDQVLVMTVNPGFEQHFLPSMLSKIPPSRLVAGTSVFGAGKDVAK